MGYSNTTSENCNDNSPSSKDVAVILPFAKRLKKETPIDLAVMVWKFCWLETSMSILLIQKRRRLSINK